MKWLRLFYFHLQLSLILNSDRMIHLSHVDPTIVAIKPIEYPQMISIIDDCLGFANKVGPDNIPHGLLICSRYCCAAFYYNYSTVTYWIMWKMVYCLVRQLVSHRLLPLCSWCKLEIKSQTQYLLLSNKAASSLQPLTQNFTSFSEA